MVSSICQFSIILNKGKQAANLYLYDQQGRLIKWSTHNFSPNQPAYLDLTGIGEEVYVLKVIAGSEMKMEKLIVQ